MAIQDIVKGSLDWHLPVNRNFHELENQEIELENKKLDKPDNPDKEGVIFQNADGSTSVVPLDTTSDLFVYGFSFRENENNSQVEYTDDAVGKLPMHSQVSTSLINGYRTGTSLGSWETTKLYRDIRPCVMNKNGTVLYYLEKDNFNLREGSLSVADPNGSTGNVMIEFPKLYWDFHRDGSLISVKLGNYKFSGSAVCYAHTDGDKERDFLYLGAFLSDYDSSKLFRYVNSSANRSSQTTFSMYNIKAQFNAAYGDNSRWHVMSYYSYLLLQILAVLFFKDRNLQNVFSASLYSNPSNIDYAKGSTLDYPFLYGWPYGQSGTKLNESVKFLGIEGFYGHRPQLLSGLILRARNYYATTDTKLYFPINSTPTYSGFEISSPAGDSFSTTGTSSFWLKTVMATNEFGFLPRFTSSSAGSAGAAYGFCDYCRVSLDTNANNYYEPYITSNPNDSLNSGPFDIQLYQRNYNAFCRVMYL